MKIRREKFWARCALTAVAAASLCTATTALPGRATDIATFHGLSPARLMDTRAGGPTIDGLYSGTGKVGDNAGVDVTVAGRGGVPATGAGAVALNITVTDPTNAGYLTVYPAGQVRPTASNLNFTPHQTIPNMVVVALGATGKISIYNDAGQSDVVVDVLGWFPATGSFGGLNPARLLDTRPGFSTVDTLSSGSGAVSANGLTQFVASGRGGVPGAGVGAVALNVTVTDPTATGYLTVYPAGATRPTASNLNFTPGLTIANMVIVPLGTSGQVTLFNGSGGTVDVVVDVLGWFPSGTAFSGLTPARLVDTRPGQPTTDGRYSGGGPIVNDANPYSLTPTTANVVVTGRGGVPAAGVGAVALNVTVTNPTSNGYLTVYPSGTHPPTASNLNFTVGQSIPNMVIVPVGNNGEIAIYNSSGSSDVIVDVLGWFPNPTSPPTSYGNAITLGSSSLGSSAFGATPTDVVAQLTPLFGAAVNDFTESFPDPLLGTTEFTNDNDDSYAYHYGRQICFGTGTVSSLCASFGANTPSPLTFTGYSYFGDLQALLFDSNGVGVGSRAADLPGAITIEPGGCSTEGTGTTASGLGVALHSRGSDFATFSGDVYVPLLPAASDVYVEGFFGGQVISGEGDC